MNRNESTFYIYLTGMDGPWWTFMEQVLTLFTLLSSFSQICFKADRGTRAEEEGSGIEERGKEREEE